MESVKVLNKDFSVDKITIETDDKNTKFTLTITKEININPHLKHESMSIVLNTDDMIEFFNLINRKMLSL